MENNVLLAVFKNQLSAYEVLNNIKSNFIGKNYVITEAAVVKKENGKVVFKEGFKVSSDGNIGFLSGGLLGAFVGIIGGPLGILLGGSLGALIGGNRGNSSDQVKSGILSDTTKYLTDNNFGLVLLATEEANSELDNYLKKYDEEVILRKDANTVQKEIEVAKEYEKELYKTAAYDEFKKKANEETDKFKNRVDDVLSDLKDKFEEADKRLKLEVAKLRQKLKK
jgi:hypothetical protein